MKKKSDSRNNQTALKATATSSQEQVILKVLEGQANGQINDATADFADEFRFRDYGIGLEFHDKKRLAEFFRKTQEFYPDSSIQIDAILVTGVPADLTSGAAAARRARAEANRSAACETCPSLDTVA